MGWLRKERNILLLILTFALLTRVIRLWYPEEFYFDEVYNAFTTLEFVKGEKIAYEWFHESPIEGTAYGWTHPPLAKLIGATGIFTVQYPEEKLPVPEEFRYIPFLLYDELEDGTHQDRCTSCGICSHRGLRITASTAVPPNLPESSSS